MSKLLKIILFSAVFCSFYHLGHTADTTKYPTTTEEFLDALDDVRTKSGDHTINLINMTEDIDIGSTYTVLCDSSVDSITISGSFKTITGNDTSLAFTDCTQVTIKNTYFKNIESTKHILSFYKASSSSSSPTKGTLDGCIFSNNQVSGSGVASVYFEEGGTIKGSSFNSNTNDYALVFSESDLLISSDSTFYNNVISNWGEVIFASGDVTLKDSELASNEAGTIVYSSGVLNLSSMYIHNNSENYRTQFYGQDSIVVTSANFLSNSGDLFETSDLIIGDSVFSNNTSKGGLIDIIDSSITITGSSFESNKNTFGTGSIINTDTSGLTIDISNSIFTSNDAEKSGGVFYFENTGAITINGSLFDSNKINASGNGGAIYANGADSLSISNSSFINNEAIDDGGAVYSYGSEVYMANLTFSGNSAGGYGGAFSGSYIKNMSHVTMAFNTAGANGGGLSATAESVNNSIIGYNTAGDSDYADCYGVIILDGGNVVSTDCGATSTSSDQLATDPLLIPTIQFDTIDGVDQYYYNLYAESPAIDLLGTCSVILADGTVSYDDQIGTRRGTVECDAGSIENQCDSSDFNYATYYADSDGDGYGDDNNTLSCCGCEQPAGYITDNHDCDDSDSSNTPLRYRDADRDGYGDASDTAYANCATGFKLGYVKNDEDCDDTDDAINPEAVEVCDDIDNDCSGAVDDNATDATTWYKDFDRDGYGTSTSIKSACDKPLGYVDVSGDCKDNNKNINPGAVEVCDDIDNDCDGKIDNNPTDGSTWYRDSDGDGFGDSGTTKEACSRPTGYVNESTDCDDSNFDVYPFAPELCDSIDNDCDGSVDEDVETGTFYADTDGDSYGNPLVTVTGCVAPSGYVSRADDCDDSSSAVSPSATEICNDVDDDCDGSIDEDPSDGFSYYKDSDGDGYGDEDTTISVCDGDSIPETYIDVSGDCDDTLDSINPSATEICDEIDNNCDGAIDDVDTDEDGISDCEAGTTTGSDTTGTDSSGGTTSGTDTTGSDSSGTTTSGTDTAGSDSSGSTTSGTESTSGTSTDGSDTTGGGVTTGSTDSGGSSGEGETSSSSDGSGETTSGTESGTESAGGGVTTGSDSSGSETTGTTTGEGETTGTTGSDTTGTDSSGGTTSGTDTTGSDTTGTSGGSGEVETPSETPETTGGNLNLSVEGGGCSLRF